MTVKLLQNSGVANNIGNTENTYQLSNKNFDNMPDSQCTSKPQKLNKVFFEGAPPVYG